MISLNFILGHLWRIVVKINSKLFLIPLFWVVVWITVWLTNTMHTTKMTFLWTDWLSTKFRRRLIYLVILQLVGILFLLKVIVLSLLTIPILYLIGFNLFNIKKIIIRNFILIWLHSLLLGNESRDVTFSKSLFNLFYHILEAS